MKLYQMKTRLVHTIEDCVYFAEKDLFSAIRHPSNKEIPILCIDFFEVQKEHRSKGYGKQLLKEFCETNKEDYLLLLVAGIVLENEGEPTKQEVEQKLSRLEKFYTSIGFLNVNNAIGQYEDKISFLYGSGLGEKVALEL